MRLRYMELPSEVEGDAVRSKFILIIPSCPVDSCGPRDE